MKDSFSLGLSHYIKEDFSRYKKTSFSLFRISVLFLSNHGFRAVLLYRLGNSFYKKKCYRIAGILQRLMYHLCFCEIRLSATIGYGLLISHANGIVVGGKTIIGNNCDIRQNVTFGGNFSKKDMEGRTQPIIGNNVSFCAGSVIVGPINIGDNAIIGANSVVTRDVPKNKIAFGVPAKILKDRWDSDLNRKL